MREKKSSPTLARADRHEIPCEWAHHVPSSFPAGAIGKCGGESGAKPPSEPSAQVGWPGIGTGKMAGRRHSQGSRAHRGEDGRGARRLDGGQGWGARPSEYAGDRAGARGRRRGG
jgi:hypothetical protein